MSRHKIKYIFKDESLLDIRHYPSGRKSGFYPAISDIRPRRISGSSNCVTGLFGNRSKRKSGQSLICAKQMYGTHLIGVRVPDPLVELFSLQHQEVVSCGRNPFQLTVKLMSQLSFVSFCPTCHISESLGFILKLRSRAFHFIRRC